MAKVFGPHQSPRAPSLRGAFYIRPGRGGMVAAAWPKPHRKKLSPRQQEAVEKFKEAAILAKYAPAEDQMRSRQLAEGSQFLPRDLQYMAIYGRLASLFFTDGQRRYQLASRYELTELLDILGFAPGSVLFRGPQFWEALSPGEVGQVLTAGDAGTPVRWANPSGTANVGGFDGATILGTTTTDSENYRSKLTLLRVGIDIEVESITFTLGGEGSNRTQAVGVWLMSDDTVNAVPVEQVIPDIVYQNGANSERLARVEVPGGPVRLLEGAVYGVAVSNRNTANIRASMLYTGENFKNVLPNGPIIPLYRAFYYDTQFIEPSMPSDATFARYLCSWFGGYIAQPE